MMQMVNLNGHPIHQPDRKFMLQLIHIILKVRAGVMVASLELQYLNQIIDNMRVRVLLIVVRA
jgi:hypothetical protein